MKTYVQFINESLKDRLNDMLLSSTIKKDIEGIKFALKHEADINHVEEVAKTNLRKNSLIWAVDINNIDIVKYLVENGSDIETINMSALCKACEKNNMDIIKYLVENGADVNYVDDMDSTPLIIASNKCNMDLVKYLVDNKADVNKSNNDKKTPLVHAAYHGCLNVVDYLIEKEADIGYEDIHGNTPLYWGFKGNTKETGKYMVNYILKHNPELSHLTIPYLTDEQKLDYPWLVAADDHGLIGFKTNENITK